VETFFVFPCLAYFLHSSLEIEKVREEEGMKLATKRDGENLAIVNSVFHSLKLATFLFYHTETTTVKFPGSIPKSVVDKLKSDRI